MFNYADFIEDVDNVTRKDRINLYNEICSLYDERVPKEYLFQGSRWFENALHEVDDLRLVYDKAFGCHGWRVAFKNYNPDMIATQISIGGEKLDNFKKSLPYAGYVVFPVTAAIYPDKNMSTMKNKVLYHGMTRSRSYLDIMKENPDIDEVRKIPTFLIVPKDSHNDDTVALQHSLMPLQTIAELIEFQKIDGYPVPDYMKGKSYVDLSKVPPLRVGKLPIGDWTNEGIKQPTVGSE